MPTPKFIFTSHQNSFKVLVENLEQLSVEQIQEIQEFVKKRKGIFDFIKYTFVIQKRLEFDEFQRLIELSELDALCYDAPVITIPKARVSFGQYKGMYYAELPDSYLLWLKGNYFGSGRKFVDNELKKRRL